MVRAAAEVRAFVGPVIVLSQRMAKSSSDNTTPRLRRSPEKGTLIGVRVQPDDLAAVDAWRDKQEDQPSRPEAIRRLVEIGLRGKAK
jgi:hypothetical protein